MKKTLSHLIPLLGLACGVAPARADVIPSPVEDARLQAGAPETIVLAGGCFWGIQAVYQHVKGVVSAVSGYAGGDPADATYDAVSGGRTGHAEAVRVVYDPAVVTPGALLRVFFSVAHDPTELNRQGPDHGTQYRSEIFFTTPEQEKIARAYVAQLDAAKAWPAPIVTKISALPAFYAAEDYHQDYATRHPNNPYIAVNDAPKVAALKKIYPDIYAEKK